MRYRQLGTTGIEVSAFTLGVMNFGTWANTDESELERIVAASVDAGINVIDTADVYSQGESEEMLGRVLARRTDRDDLIIATKFYNPVGTDRNNRGSGRRWIVRAVEDSLRRMKLEHIDLYQAHRPDPTVPIDDTLGTLSDLVHQGKIRHFGTSTFTSHQLTEAHWSALARGRELPVTEQLPYSILAREAEREVLDVALKYRLGVLSWSPLAGGWLSGSYRSETSTRLARQPERHAGELPENAQKRQAVQGLAAVAEEAGLPLAQLAVAFVLANRAISTAIVGPRTLDQLTSLLAAADLDLAPEVLAAIDEIVPPGRTINPADTGYPREHAAAILARQRGAHAG